MRRRAPTGAILTPWQPRGVVWRARSVMARCALPIAAALLGCVAAQPTVQLDALGTDGIRIRIAPPGVPIVEPPLQALLGTQVPSRRADAAPAYQGPLSLTNGNLQVTADASTGLITATRVSDGAVLLQQVGLAWGPPAVGSRPNSSSVTVAFAGTPGELVYGLGEHRTGTVQQMPFFRLFQDVQYYPISHGGESMVSWYSSSRGYGFLWNLPSYGWVNLTNAQLAWHSNATMNADFWVTTLPPTSDPAVSPHALLLHNMVDVVGHAPAAPYYATGFIQCKNRYRNQTQLMDVARGYVSRGLPISTIVIDYYHWVNMGDWTLNPACWPDPVAMVAELTEMGIQCMITFWPFQTTPSQHWAQYAGGGLLATNLTGGLAPLEGDYFLYDATNPLARNTTFADWYAGYGQLGVKTIWLDAAEPERTNMNNFGQFQLQAGTDTEVGMAWTQQHVRTFADGMPTIGVGASDYFVLPRHIWTGSWRYSAGLWSGDIVSTFDELALQVRVGQGVQMSGQVLWTTDIGGYANGDPTDPVFQELIVRWFQFGAFCPLFRLHGHRAGGPAADECGPTNGDNEVWNLATDPVKYGAITAVMRLRENLRPYVAAINQEAADTGMPMMRPMVLQFPLDPACAGPDVEDQFMLGPNWLVAPVLEYQATNRSVYLPALPSNETWVYWWSQTPVPSAVGQRITVATPIDEFPLYVRRPVPAPPPAPWTNATALFSTQRLDQVLCVSEQCYSSNAPGDQGDYAVQFVDCVALAGDAGGAVTLNGTSYPTVALNLFFSFPRDDNVVMTNATAPDASYTITFDNGYVLGAAAPGAVPLQLWLRAWNASKVDWAAVSSPQGVAWATGNGYAFQFNSGFVLPPATAAGTPEVAAAMAL